MTAFCGAVNFDGAPIDPGLLRTMMQPLTSGGRAEIRLFVEGAFAFASLGGNGFAASSGPVAVACDARLDRRERLADDLFPGAKPAARTDAEILLAAYQRWGSRWHEHLHGALAAALWDGREKTLILLRDRLGERGLYWGRSAGRLFFASEPILIAASREINRKPHQLRLLSYLLDASPHPAWSFFEGIRRAPEGCQLRVHAERDDLERCWSWQQSPEGTPEPGTAAQELAARLREAVSRRLPASGETGVLLSSGLDSCSVAAAADDLLRARGRRLRAFTWTSKSGDGIDETPRSRLFLASRPDVSEQGIEADGLWPLSRFPEAYSDPNSPETNAYPDLLLSTIEQARRSGVSVLLNGIGGDSMIGWIMPELTLLATGRLGYLGQRWRQAGFRPRQMGIVREIRLMTSRRRLPDWLTPAAQQIAREAKLDRPAVCWRTVLSPRRFRSQLISEPSNASTLERYGRLSHRTGVRIEAPWCDADLASLVISIPGNAFAESLPAKALLREAMAGQLPTEIQTAPTEKGETSGLAVQGFLSQATGAVQSLLQQSRLHDCGILDAGVLIRQYDNAIMKGHVMPLRFWEVLTAEAWYRAQEVF